MPRAHEYAKRELIQLRAVVIYEEHSMAVAINVSVDYDLKKQAEAVFAGIGLTTQDAIRMFLRQCVIEQGLPLRTNLRANAAPASVAPIKRKASTAPVEAQKMMERLKSDLADF